MHYSSVDLHEEDIWGCDRLLYNWEYREPTDKDISQLSPFRAIPWIDTSFQDMHECILANLFYVSFYGWNERSLDCLPRYNVNVKILEKQLPIIAVVIQ